MELEHNSSILFYALTSFTLTTYVILSVKNKKKERKRFQIFESLNVKSQNPKLNKNVFNVGTAD